MKTHRDTSCTLIARALVSTAVLTVSVACIVALPGCQGDRNAVAPRADLPPLPTYAEVAARYNTRADKLGRLWARAVIRLTYKDEKGEPHTDQGEGLLQMIRPERVALSIKKAGKMLFWFGCDDQRYWFFDVVDEKIARVGRHARPGERERTDAAGIAIPPRELFELIGLSPLDASARGTTAWSPDGNTLIVTIPHPQGGVRVFSLDPGSFEPQNIEQRTAKGAVVISARLKTYEGVDLTGVGGLRPRIATEIDAIHNETDTRIRLDLSEMKDSGISDIAFRFEDLCKSMGVDKIIDVDSARPAPSSNQNK